MKRYLKTLVAIGSSVSALSLAPVPAEAQALSHDQQVCAKTFDVVPDAQNEVTVTMAPVFYVCPL